jgi:hypothetical protein
VGYPRFVAPPADAEDQFRVDIDPRTGAATITDGTPPPERLEPELESAVAAALSLRRPLKLGRRRVLLPASRAPHGSLLSRLFAVLARVEAASHVLVWGREVEGAHALLLEAVELPRLRQSFCLRAPRLGALILESRERAGFHLSDARPPHLAPLLAGLPFSLVLQRVGEGVDPRAAQLLLVAPSFPVRRPTVGGLPFSVALRPARRPGWLEHARAMGNSRVFAYEVHPSGAMLAYKDRSAALFHVGSLLWARRYEDAASVLHCAVLEGAPSPEQAWLLQNALMSGDDAHPDAIALRLRLLADVLLACEERAAGGTARAAGISRADNSKTVPSPFTLLALGNGE